MYRGLHRGARLLALLMVKRMQIAIGCRVMLHALVVPHQLTCSIFIKLQRFGGSAFFESTARTPDEWDLGIGCGRGSFKL